MLKIYCSEYILVDSKSITVWGGATKSVKMAATSVEGGPRVYPVLCLGSVRAPRKGQDGHRGGTHPAASY